MRRRRYGHADDGRSALRHEGKSQDFLRRHAHDCSRYDCSTLTERFRFARDFVQRVANTANLWCAVLHLVGNGEKAPGPNRQRLYRLLDEDPGRVWRELRAIRAALLAGNYQPGPTRRVNVPKSPGRGTRPIDILNWQDQVVQRGIVQILDPFLDNQFDEQSLGYRTGHDRFEAIARAGALMELADRQILVCADLQDAFTRIPHTPLLREVEARTGNVSLTRLIRRIILAGNRTRGVAQGGALSPFLLNLHLDRHLDQPWRRAHPDTTLIRVADDLLLLCRSTAEAETRLDHLRRLLRPTSMTLKEEKTQICNLPAGETADWLGFTLRRHEGALRVEPNDDFHQNARDSLYDNLAKSDGALRTTDAMEGIVDQLGPCLISDEQTDAVICQLADLAAQTGFHEPPDPALLRGTGRRSALRFQLHQYLWRLVYTAPLRPIDALGSGSASSQITPAHFAPGNARGDSVVAATSPMSAAPTAQLTITCVSPRHGVSGVAYHVQFPCQWRTVTKSMMSPKSIIRLTLRAAVDAIRLIPPNMPVRIVTDSAYLAGEWRSQLDAYRQRGERRFGGSGRRACGLRMPNLDLMTALDRETSWRIIGWELRNRH